MIFSLIGMVLVGAVVGYAASVIFKSKSSGFWNNVIIGIIGSFLGGALLSIVGFSTHGIIASLISDLLGALALLWAIHWYTEKKK